MSAPVEGTIQRISFLEGLGGNRDGDQEEAAQSLEIVFSDQTDPDKYTLVITVDLERKALEDRYPKNLYQTLLAGIQPMHQIVRHNEFLISLRDGKFDAHAYTKYLCNLHAIHQAIELIQNKIITIYGEDYFVFPILFRSAEIRKDIRLWSIFNPLSEKFADKDPNDPSFITAIDSVVEYATKAFVQHMESIQQENILHSVGALYALYGGLLAGDQIIKDGIINGFVARVLDNRTTGNSELFVTIQRLINENPEMRTDIAKKYAGMGACYFTFPDEFSIPQFKTAWHENLNALVNKLSLEGQEKEEFETNLIEEANFAIRSVVNLISTLYH